MRVPLDPASLAKVPLFNGVDFTAVGATASANALITMVRNEVLFRQGDPCTGLYFVRSGRIRLTVSARTGAATTVEIIGDGETFGEAVVFLRRPYPVTATALADSTLYFISSHMIDAMLTRDPEFTRRILANLAMRNHQLVADVAALTLDSTTSRVCGFLLRLCPQPWPDDTITVTLTDTKRVIADRLSLTPESFSRALRRLADRGLITSTGRFISLNPHQLAAEIDTTNSEASPTL